MYTWHIEDINDKITTTMSELWTIKSWSLIVKLLSNLRAYLVGIPRGYIFTKRISIKKNKAVKKEQLGL